MAEYIEREALLRMLPEDLPYKGSVKRVLMQAPTADVVEVVRCKDCKYFTKEMIGGDLECICACAFAMINIDPDRYCSYGERREGIGLIGKDVEVIGNAYDNPELREGES